MVISIPKAGMSSILEITSLLSLINTLLSEGEMMAWGVGSKFLASMRIESRSKWRRGSVAEHLDFKKH